MEYSFDIAEKLIRDGGRSHTMVTDELGRELKSFVAFNCLTWEVPVSVFDQFRFCLSEMENTFEAISKIPELSNKYSKDSVAECNCYFAEPKNWTEFDNYWEDFWRPLNPETHIRHASFMDDRVKVEVELIFSYRPVNPNE